MLLFRIFVVVAAVLLLMGCGFKPLYHQQEKVAVQEKLSEIAVALIPERSGQFLRQELITLLHAGQSPEAGRYVLSIELKEEINYLGIQRDASSSYARLNLQAIYRLMDTQKNTMLLQDITRAMNGYTIVVSQYASLTAEQDAREKSLRQIAHNISRQLSIYFNDHSSQQALQEQP